MRASVAILVVASLAGCAQNGTLPQQSVAIERTSCTDMGDQEEIARLTPGHHNLTFANETGNFSDPYVTFHLPAGHLGIHLNATWVSGALGQKRLALRIADHEHETVAWVEGNSPLAWASQTVPSGLAELNVHVRVTEPEAGPFGLGVALDYQDVHLTLSVDCP